MQTDGQTNGQTDGHKDADIKYETQDCTSEDVGLACLSHW